MASYSHSKVSSFEQCPYKYKLKYVDKVKVDIPNTIEAFMGDLVHRSLEKLYAVKGEGRIMLLDEVLEFYLRLWSDEFSDDILIAKASQGLTGDSYKMMGLKFLMDHYARKHPFDGREIVGLETKDMFELKDGNKWYVMIDKLERDGFGNYFVCDYKTNARMKSREEVESDRQLAMYASWVKKNFSDAKNVILLWDMLAFNTEVTSTRSSHELEELHDEVVSTIARIESTTNFPMKPSALCNYCVFKDICPSKNPSVKDPIPTSIPQKKLFS